MGLLKWILIVLGILVLALVTALFFVKVRIVFGFSKKSGKKPRTSLDISICGFSLGKLTKKKAKKHSLREDTQAEDDTKFFDKVKKYYSLFLDFKDTYKKNSRKIRRTVHFEKICLNVQFGLGDAAKTGIATGGVWAGIYNVIALVAKLFTISEPKVDVAPLYNEQICEVEAECIISARLAKLIYTLASVGISYYFICRGRRSRRPVKQR